MPAGEPTAPAAGGIPLVARVVATTNRPKPELLTLRSTITLYRIHVRQFADRTRSWCVLRRYSEFAELHAVLCRAVASPLPPLPPKLVLNTPSELAERYLGLDSYLHSVLSMPNAAAHPRLRSFLGADAVTAPAPSELGAAAAGDVEDDWDHESEPRQSDPALGEDRAADATTADAPRWLLTGAWVADEERSRDTLEPMLRAMGTPWAARRLLRGLAITSTLTHEPGVRLVEVASSRLGEGRPATFELDGVARPLPIGKREGTVRAVELPRAGAVRLHIVLPEGAGCIVDTRRVLPSGREVRCCACACACVCAPPVISQPPWPLRPSPLIPLSRASPSSPTPSAVRRLSPPCCCACSWSAWWSCACAVSRPSDCKGSSSATGTSRRPPSAHRRGPSRSSASR